MVDSIRLDMQAVEHMLFFWNMIAEREKVSEIYILSVAELEQYRGVYDEEFDNISVRKVMSALSNREVFRSDNRKESRFWVDNLWMLEDLDYTMEIVAPLKRLNLDDVVGLLNERTGGDSPYGALRVVFVPFYNQTHLIRGRTLYLNFFKALPQRGERQTLQMGGKPLKTFILDALTEVVHQAQEGTGTPQGPGLLRNVFY